MGRCRSWRFTGADLDPSRHLPVGSDTRAWRPCRARIPDGQQRCDACSKALLSCPNAKIRAALADEPGIPGWVLLALASDGDATVAAIAGQRIQARGGAEAVRSGVRQAVQAAAAMGGDPWAGVG